MTTFETNSTEIENEIARAVRTIKRAAIDEMHNKMRKALHNQIDALQNESPESYHKLRFILEGLSVDQLNQVADFVYSFSYVEKI